MGKELKKLKKEFKKEMKKEKAGSCGMKGGCGGCGYFLGFLGAAIYYISYADSFWMGVLGVLKALVWPAFLVFALLKFVGA